MTHKHAQIHKREALKWLSAHRAALLDACTSAHVHMLREQYAIHLSVC